jgi:ppGpp synthetase/RelA/SpoT-type nucleotidyltranferase
MSEADFQRRWESEKAFYEAWGLLITEIVAEALLEALGGDRFATFLKIPTIPRIKETPSLLEKAFMRDKDYKNPYEDITDKVGIRFVVLTIDGISAISSILEKNTSWAFSLDRDFEEERKKRPEYFGYQSKHYVLRAAQEFEFGGRTIPKDTPCEVQIRTLLQHAHSELTHDTIYKPRSTEASPLAKRYIARSMALSETVDEFFCQVAQEFEKAEAAMRDLGAFLSNEYQARVGSAPEPARSNELILDALMPDLPADVQHQIGRFIADTPYVPQRVAGRAKDQLLYRQPSILLAYWMADYSPGLLKDRWPLTQEEMRLIFSDIGRSLD